jgi:uncharacterized membrane protein
VNADQSSGIRLTRAVEEAERHTGCEVIVVGFACADGYLDVAFRNAFVVALVALGLVLMVPVDIHEVLVFPIVAGASLAAFWISHLPGVARVTSTRKRRGAAIRTAMAEAFLKQGVSRTRDRVGVLIAFFELERDAAVLFDTGLQARIPGDVRASITETVRKGCAATDIETRAACITAIGARLGAWVPREANDVDELPNAPKTGGTR